MQKIKLITDTPSDIPPQFENGIEILSVPISIDGKEYLERKDFSPTEFYDIVGTCKEIPKTSHVPLVDFVECFERLFKEGYDHAIFVSIASKGSNTLNVARMAGDMFFSSHPEAKDKITLHFIDSKSYAYSYGYAVVKANAMARSGKSIDEILAFLGDWFSRLEIFFAVYNLDFAKKSGRISVAAAFAGELIGLRPVLSIIDGKIDIFDKVRGDKNVLPRLLKEVSSRISKGSEYVVLKGTVDAQADEMAALLTEKLGYPPAGIFHLGAAITINAGPSAIGIAFLGEKRGG